MLANLVYAGAYAWRRSVTRTDLADGQRRVARELRSDPEEWPVLIRDHYDGYFSWDECMANQRMIADNAGSIASTRGAVRGGGGLKS